MLGTMAKDSTGLSRADKRAGSKAARKAKRVRRKDSWVQMWVAFKITRRRDRAMVWWLLAALVGITGVVFAGLTLLGVFWPVGLLFGLTLGVLVAMIIFSRRAQNAAFAEADGQPGAAAWVLQNMRGKWLVTPTVTGNAQFDTVHRVLGRPGVILVGEGAPHRLKGLLSQEKKRVARVVGDTPIYDVVVGTEADQVPLRKLQNHLIKLPSNLTPAQVTQVDKRLQALAAGRPAMPKGPLPKNVKGLTGLQRTIRRR
ncbi:MAG: DUF4191 domain-containing protein [Actinobacteria bacterium]|nr:DUF4191 domain-containing protein [Actinomycetota bacterium]